MSTIYTNKKCIGCNKCIKSCPTLLANVAWQKEKSIAVNLDACITCGACMDACNHAARDYEDDTDAFLDDLRSGKHYAVIVAPAFLSNYPDTYKRIFGYLMKAGVTDIYPVAFGADITTWAYLKLLCNFKEEGEGAGEGKYSIASPCPAIVNYIEHYRPELVSQLIPVHSPMMCEAIYLKKYQHVKEELVFLSPCIAKLDEIREHKTIKYNVTFQKLMEAIGDSYKTCVEYEPEHTYGLGIRYPHPGGLKENVRHFLGDVPILQVEGEDVYTFLDSYADYKGTKPVLVDILNCKKGCLRGPGTDKALDETGVLLANPKTVIPDEPKKRLFQKKVLSPWSTELSHEDRLALFDAQFVDLDLQDFMRKFIDKSVKCKTAGVAEADRIYASMLKDTKEERCIDCTCCGYSSCEKMVQAIHNGVNSKENCIYYNKKVAEMEKQEIAAMHEDNVKEQELHHAKLKDIIEQFALLNTGVSELASANELTAQDATDITHAVSDITEQCENIRNNLGVFTDFIQAYRTSNKEINDIAGETNLLSLNASIEAAHAGDAGRGFAIVAGNIRELSDNTKKLIEQNNEKASAAVPKIEASVQAIVGLLASIEEMNNRITNIAATTEEISAQSENIQTMSDGIQRQVEEI